ncbi:hypothetical protein BSZ07_37625 [Streptomyces sp. M1013]|nr:hypothetical protein BSZ07_37625 [Streptomyces sp. M1013]
MAREEYARSARTARVRVHGLPGHHSGARRLRGLRDADTDMSTSTDDCVVEVSGGTCHGIAGGADVGNATVV